MGVNATNNEDAADLLIKPARRPVLKSPESKIEQASGSSNSGWDPLKLGEKEERNKIIESLGEGIRLQLVERVVTQSTKIEKVLDEKSKLDIAVKFKSQLVAPIRLPLTIQPQWQSKPSATPVKRTPTLKDFGSSPKPANTDERKIPAPGKFKDDFRKKSGALARMPKANDDDDDEIHDDETSELNVSIPGAKKGRKWSKASKRQLDSN
ncbi:hypothetical protein R6Q59_033436 [Mikania micrantha]